jgi:hypothetical protein
MDCQSFDASVLDLLYAEARGDGELDATGRALEAHAAECSDCRAKVAKLRRTRELYLPALMTPPPSTLEARILAAAEKAEAQMPARAPAVAARSEDADADANANAKARSGSRGNVFRLFARPELAIAATFVLVAGGAAVFLQRSKSEATSLSAAAPMGAVASSASAAADEPAPTPTIAATEDPASASALALATPPPMPALARAAKSGPRHMERGDLDGAEGKADNARGGGGGGAGPAGVDFRAAKALYDAGRYAEALPKLDAVAATDPGSPAALYAARCVARTSGCSAAATRYDRIAKDRAGTEPGSRAALEIARCFRDAGQTAAARTRYGALTTDNYVASEANADLAALDVPRAAAKPAARPAATATAAPAR